MTRPSYRRAIEWIALEDDEDLGENSGWIMTVCIIADLFDKTTDEVGQAVIKHRKKVGRL